MVQLLHQPSVYVSTLWSDFGKWQTHIHSFQLNMYFERTSRVNFVLGFSIRQFGTLFKSFKNSAQIERIEMHKRGHGMLFIYDNHLKHLWNWTGFQYGPPCNKPKIRSLVTIPTTSFFYANRIWKSLCLLHTWALPNAERSAMCAVFDLFLTISSRFRFNCCWFKTKIFIPKSRRQKIVASTCKAKAVLRANLPLVVPCHTLYHFEIIESNTHFWRHWWLNCPHCSWCS